MTVRAASEPLDEAAMAAARAHLDRLTKPPGSLGRLERLVEQLAGITGSSTPRVDRPAVVVFAGDHGVTARGVSAYPSDVTAQMVANFIGGGAAINVLADAAGAELVVVDVGVAGVLPAADERAARLVRARVRSGTRDMTLEPAMTREEADAAIAVGREVVGALIERGCDAVALGEMGIGNTTAASALVAALTGRPPVRGHRSRDRPRRRGRAPQGRRDRGGARSASSRRGRSESVRWRRLADSRSRRSSARSSQRPRPARRSSSTGSSPAPRHSSQRPSRPAWAVD